MATRTSSLDTGYTTGQLSVYPLAVDDKDTLYEAKNNASTILKHSLAYNGTYITVEDASSFPTTGLIRVGPKDGKLPAELIYYGKRTDSIFSQLQRGFAGSRQNYWPSQVTYVTNAVMAEHHNAVKDAIVNIEANLGLKYSSTEDSLNGILKKQEERFLPAKGQFTAYPRYTVPNAIVTFHNFSSGHIVRFLWDFGDGTTSIEKNPTHKYLAEGNYTVKLNVITSDGMQGVTNKLSYINISEENHFTFFYAVPSDPDAPNYSIESAATAYAGGDPTAIAQVFEFVDQSEGDISQRIWVFGDGTSSTITDPDKHSINHTYQSPGEYSPTLLLIKSTQKIKRVESSNTIVVI